MILDLARGLYFIAAMALFGHALFALLLRAKLKIESRLPGRVLVVLVALIASFAWLVLAAGEMAGTTPDLATIQATITGTLFGQMLALRIVLLLVLFVVRGPRATALLASAALALPAITSHAAVTSPAGFAAIGIVVDATHLLAAGFWIGGLVGLAALFARGEPEMPAALDIFSDGAMVAVLVLVMTGLINATQILLGEKEADSPRYLTVLGLKLALVGVMLALATVNRFRLLPRRQMKPLARNVSLELALGCVVLLLAGWLGQMSPTL